LTAGISEPTRLVTLAAGRAIGGAHRRLGRWADPREENTVSILTCVDSPSTGYSTYSTVSLHEHENRLDGRDIRTELAGVAETTVTAYPDVLSTAAFYVIKDQWLVAPGVVFPGLLLDYELGTEMEHIMWAPPFPWAPLQSVEISPDLTVHWLVAVPIYESERQFLLLNGYFEFEDRLEAGDTQYFDLRRPRVA
jgi:hypothetical protein